MVHKKKNRRFGAGFSKLWENSLGTVCFLCLGNRKGIERKMNVFSELIHSVYDLKSYGIFLKDRKRKTFLFGFLLV